MVIAALKQRLTRSLAALGRANEAPRSILRVNQHFNFSNTGVKNSGSNKLLPSGVTETKNSV